MCKRIILSACILLLAGGIRGQESSPFAPSNLGTATGKYVDPDAFYEAADCGECHVSQYKQWNGSMHSRAHHDSIYLAFANRAREEGGEALYKFCSSCHAPIAVASGEIPNAKEHTFVTNEGVNCDACHTVKQIIVKHAGGGSNASIVLEEGEVRYGPLKDPAPTTAHESAYSETHAKSEFCSACHTLTHPTNGLVIENTYEEWKHGPYAKAGIQCQDCHMRTADQAAEVARTMKPLKVPGKAFEDGDERPNVYAHLFTGGNANRALTGSGELHAAEAEKRLKNAATVALKLPANAAAGASAEIEVAVTNVGAGHSIPTSITELRQIWIDLGVKDASGKEVFRSGALQENGAIGGKAVIFTTTLGDKDGKVTYLPWLAAKILKEELIGPKETVRKTFKVALPAGSKGPFAVRAVLRYRSAPQEVMDELFGKGKFKIRVIDMAEATAELSTKN